MSKKWYEHFISIETEGAGEPSVSASPVDGTAPAAGRSAAQAIADIAATIQPPAAPQQQQMAQVAQKAVNQAMSSASAPLSLTEIYEAAEIRPPAHGYTILKVADMLQSKHIKDLPPEVRKSSVLVALDAAGVKVQDIIEDAVKRDKALDTFERMQQKQVEEFEAAKIEENRKHQAEMDRLIAECKAKMEGNQKSILQRKEAFHNWRSQKQMEEDKIAAAIAHFVTENPITTSR